MENAGKSVNGNTRIVFLDYLRIFAFTSVLAAHKFYAYIVAFSNNEDVHPTLRFIANILASVLYGGGSGVIVFFLVSGYIITHVLQTELPVEFLIKRIFRVFPLYIVAIITEYLSLLIANEAPSFSVLLQQLLLIGDIFGTPYALNGVEWTLRVEVTFYIFMAITRALNLMTIYKRALPAFLLITTIFCSLIAPIPSINVWSKGYLTIYGPFLLLGSMIYLFEKKQIGLAFLSLFIVVFFYQHYSLMVLYQRNWTNSHFSILGFLIFLICWSFRNYMTAAPWVLLLSDLTYSVYLFHNWFFDCMKKMMAALGIKIFHPDIQALVILFLTCFLMVKCVEKPGIRLGRSVLRKIIAIDRNT